MTTPGMSSGIAVILLDDERENYIVGIYGANMACDEIQVQATSLALDGADALLLQMEIPLDVSLEAARKSLAKRGVRVIYDPAPPSEISLPRPTSPSIYHCPEPVRSRGSDRCRPLSGIDSAHEAARVYSAHVAPILRSL